MIEQDVSESTLQVFLIIGRVGPPFLPTLAGTVRLRPEVKNTEGERMNSNNNIFSSHPSNQPVCGTLESRDHFLSVTLLNTYEEANGEFTASM